MYLYFKIFPKTLFNVITISVYVFFMLANVSSWINICIFLDQINSNKIIMEKMIPNTKRKKRYQTIILKEESDSTLLICSLPKNPLPSINTIIAYRLGAPVHHARNTSHRSATSHTGRWGKQNDKFCTIVSDELYA